ncbi:twin-arginine translocation signal domain-containing protein [Variovorax sp. J22P240]
MLIAFPPRRSALKESSTVATAALGPSASMDDSFNPAAMRPRPSRAA